MKQINVKHSGTLRFWGKWFGRPMDNYHQVVNACFDETENILTLTFDEDEICKIFNPTGIISNKNEFYVSNATKVIWQYYNYGKARKLEDLITIEYEKIDSTTVLEKTNGGIGKMNPIGFYAIEIC